MGSMPPWLVVLVGMQLACACHSLKLPGLSRIGHRHAHREPSNANVDPLSDTGAVVLQSQSEDAVDAANKSPAGIQVAARQALFDYSTAQALDILRERVQKLQVPDVTKAFSIPVVGNFELQLSNIKVTNFACDPQAAKLTILNGFFHMVATGVEASLSFNWHWTKAGLSGSGEGELLLHGGAFDYVFDVQKDEQIEKPQLNVVTANCNFDSVELKIHSYSADWLYQAVLSLFNEAIKKRVQDGVSGALEHDVPSKINQVLASLPTHIDVTGLPFSTAFDYSIYTLSFVLIKGFGEIEVGAAARKAATAVSAVAAARRLAMAQERAGGIGAGALLAAMGGDGGGELPRQMMRCPFDTSPLPLTGEQIGADGHMVSIYLHEATINCLLWGLYSTDRLKFTLQDGTIKGLTITTDLLAMLIPELPTRYPHQKLRFDIQALGAPQIAFDGATGTTLSAYYRMALVVQNETLGNPEVARLAANLTVTGFFDWDSFQISDAVAHHEVEASTLSVPPEQWDNMVGWFIVNYGGMGSLKQLVDLAVHTPVASMVKLQAAKVTNMDHWVSVSSDVSVVIPAPARAA